MAGLSGATGVSRAAQDAGLKNVSVEEKMLASAYNVSISTIRRFRDVAELESQEVKRYVAMGQVPEETDSEILLRLGIEPDLRESMIGVAQWVLFWLHFHETGLIQESAKFANIPPFHLNRRQKIDRVFQGMMADARKNMLKIVENAAMERGVNGTLRPVYHQGLKCGEYREYSDKCLSLMHTTLREDTADMANGCSTQLNKAKKEGAFTMTLDGEETRVNIEEARTSIFNKLLGDRSEEGIEADKTQESDMDTESMSRDDEEEENND